MFNRGILFYSNWPFGQARAIFLIGEQVISGLSDRGERKLEQSSVRRANAQATPGWPASNHIKYLWEKLA